ncbi:MAG: bile acid:sodium symporter family protein [Akkermansia sp.]|nr:bile acid:sodium symporter family protein [Akkermansia sp.]
MRFLLACSTWLSAYTAPFIIAVAALTCIFPSAFDWVRGDIQTCILGGIMLTMGMTLTTEDFRILAQRPWDIFIGAVAQYTIMPLLACALVYCFGLPKGIAAGLILVGCSPGGVSSNIMSLLCKGDVAYSVGMTTASTLLAPLMTPLLVLWLAGESIEVDAWGLFRSILLVTLLPVGVGTFCNWTFRHSSAYQTFCRLMPGAAVLGLACIVGGVTSAHGNSFFESGALIFLCIFLHNSLGYVLGYMTGLLTRMGKAKRRTLSIEVGMQNAGLATVLAGRHFPLLPEAAIAAAISCVWHSISGTLIAALFSLWDKRHRK